MSCPIFCIYLLEWSCNLLRLLSTFLASSCRSCGLNEFAEIYAFPFLARLLGYALTFTLFLFERALRF